MAGILSCEPPFDHKITRYEFSVEDAYRLLADFKMKTTTKPFKSFGSIGKLVPERNFSAGLS